MHVASNIDPDLEHRSRPRVIFKETCANVLYTCYTKKVTAEIEYNDKQPSKNSPYICIF